MSNLSKHARSPHSPSPIYGIRPGFTIADLEGRYMHSFRVYGTYQAPNAAPPPDGTWDAVAGVWKPLDKILTQKTTTDSLGTVISPHARVVKITMNISGTGTVDLSVSSAVDSYGSTIADYSALPAGSYEFFLGGWSSADSDNTSYVATQYGPNPNESPDANNPSGDQDIDDPTFGTSSNYVGGTYNPFQFLSLDGYDLKFFAAVSGSVGYDVTVTTVS